MRRRWVIGVVLAMAGCREGADGMAYAGPTPAFTGRCVGERVALAASSASAPAPAPPPAESRAVRFDAEAPDDWLPRATPAEAALDGPAVDRLIADAMRAESDALLLVKDGRVVVERYFGQRRGPIETRSITKSVAALAVLALVADGRIASLDVPLSTFFPELATGERAAISLRHVLTHTSGLAHGEDADALNAQADRLRYVRSLPLASPPGRRFSYNNEASQLLAGVIARASGQPADVYVRERIFAPLGIGEHGWAHDRSGGPQTYFGLSVHARDLARIGLMLLDGGRAGGHRVLPEALVQEALTRQVESPPFGLLWWLRCRLGQKPVDALERAGFPAAAALAPLAGARFVSEEAYFTAAGAVLSRPQVLALRAFHRAHGALAPDPCIGFFAVGGQGQRLAVFPAARLVAVRQHRRRPGDDAKDARVTWRAFLDRVEAVEPALSR
jgi:CubicO group peptidase (beta-lactamase class C family)